MPTDRPTLQSTIGWDAKLATVAGRHAKTIEKAFGYRTVGELLSHYPRRWVERDKLSEPEKLEVDGFVTVLARVASVEPRPYRDRRTGQMAYRLQVVLETGGIPLTLTFFDKTSGRARWRQGEVVAGHYGLFSGKVGRFRSTWQLTNPRTLVFGSGEEAEQALARMPNLIPIYPATAAIQSWQIGEAVAVALDLVHEIPEVLPEEVRTEQGLLSARQALTWLHRPDSRQQIEAAAARLRFDEAFVTQTVLAQRRAALLAQQARPRTGREGGLLDRFDARLPFELTTGQQEVGRTLLEDLAAGHPMHRLLQGEVGSGKTVVALRAMLRVVDSGGQAALLAPTEVLAQQHRRSITAMLGDLAAGGMLGGDDEGTRVALLTGALGAAARREALLDTASGSAGIVIGTHALLEDRVQFADLGLVVVDEQHRFGVEQRAALSAKAGDVPPHVLVMTATPIPRTVAMTVFGDLETSTLRELPAGRAPIRTNVVALPEHPSWLERAYERIVEEVAAGHQVYVVCPRISGDDLDNSLQVSDLDDSAPLAAVDEVAPMLAGGPLSGLRVAALHGRLAPEVKDRVMTAFADGEVDVLVTTTVVEVGVDVANATMMVVLDAERFGVSQLHQLRGRIGRGGLPGLCLLVTNAPDGSPGRERVEAVAGTTDGFELSRVDLQQRREGDVLGSSQSGRRSSLRLLHVLEHEDVIVAARAVAVAVVADDPALEEHPQLAAQVRRLHEAEQADFVDKA